MTENKTSQLVNALLDTATHMDGYVLGVGKLEYVAFAEKYKRMQATLEKYTMLPRITFNETSEDLSLAAKKALAFDPLSTSQSVV